MSSERVPRRRRPAADRERTRAGEQEARGGHAGEPVSPGLGRLAFDVDVPLADRPARLEDEPHRPFPQLQRVLSRGSYPRSISSPPGRCLVREPPRTPANRGKAKPIVVGAATGDADGVGLSSTDPSRNSKNPRPGRVRYALAEHLRHRNSPSERERRKAEAATRDSAAPNTRPSSSSPPEP